MHFYVQRLWISKIFLVGCVLILWNGFEIIGGFVEGDLSNTTKCDQIYSYCGKIGFLPNRLKHVGTDLCADIIDVISHSSKLVLKVSNKKVNLVGCVMEGSMVFCQKNILEHSVSFRGDYIKRCLLTHRVSQILYLTKLIFEIKYFELNGLFTTLRQLWIWPRLK